MQDPVNPPEDVAIQFLVFSAGGQQWGVEAKHVTHVIQDVSPTRLPNTPDGISGIAFHNDSPTVVLDMGYIFTGDTTHPESNIGIIIERGGNIPMTLLVSAVDSIYTVPGEYIKTDPERGTIPSSTIAGLCGVVIQNTAPSETTLPEDLSELWIVSPNELAMCVLTSVIDQTPPTTESTSV